MVFFLAFLVLTTFVVPVFTLVQIGRLAVTLSFVLTLVFGALATIRSQFLKSLAVGIAVAVSVTDLIAEFAPTYSIPSIETSLKLVCLLILVFMTLKRILRPGPVNVYRVVGGIVAYLLMGYAWTFAYLLLAQGSPAAIQFAAGPVDLTGRQPAALLYFSFVTLTTVGYGDAYPVHPAVRSLAIAEALVGQLYLAILIASLVGMALQRKLEIGNLESSE